MHSVMKKFLVILVQLLIINTALAAHEQIVEFELSGLTCSFCVYGLKKNLEKHTDVEKAKISLKQNKARIHLIPNAKITIKELEEIIKDAGFSSGNSQFYGRAEHPCDTATC